jgi:hypothetical protein
MDGNGMKTFLHDLAFELYHDSQAMEELTIVFPNRRAALYFRKHLSEIIQKPVFAPRLTTIEDFFSSLHPALVPDKLDLVHRLHQTYQRILDDSHAESFDQFYFWGDMLLRDFDEMDKYLVHAAQLFQDLRNQKELDSSFDFLTDEQKKFLLDFWKSFAENITGNKKKFIDVWSKLHGLYVAFREELAATGQAYEGMLQRAVAEKISDGSFEFANPQHVVFAGFNALTKAEEMVMAWFADRGGRLFWDGDEYYVNDSRQEAGTFLQLYQEHPSFRKTFPAGFPAHFRQEKTVNVFGSAQVTGQAKLMAQTLQQELTRGLVPEETLIVLPDEKMLMPVLYGIPEGVSKLNVTMGYNLSNTPLFSLLEMLIELQIAQRQHYFNHRQVLTILGHPYVVAAHPGEAHIKRQEILRNNWVQIPQAYLAATVPLHRLLFAGAGDGIIAYLLAIVHEIGSIETLHEVDREFAFQFVKLLHRVQSWTMDVMPSDDIKERNRSLKSFLRLFRQVVRTQKLPFSGEPLRGLQIMGVLETRNLDFKNVFILSLNEGVFPSFGGKGSYIPYNIRRAYALPTREHQDAIYAYLFYRVLQRAENVFLFYHTETDDLGQGEMSRYLQQLLFESGWKIGQHVLHTPVQPLSIEPIVIRKDEATRKAIHRLNEGTARFRGISPSALRAYIECKLKFYFKHIARIREPYEVEEDADARILGNIFHKVMERFYKRLQTRKKNNLVEPGDFQTAENDLAKLVDEAFTEAYRLDPARKVEYEGQWVMVREIVLNLAGKVLAKDKAFAPFVMEAIESEGLLYNVKIDQAPGFAVIGGKIDRVDSKGDTVRVIDYKTGKDETEFESLASLFETSKKGNKAAFQTLLYALLYRVNHPAAGRRKVVPGLINRNYMLGDGGFGFKLKKAAGVVDANELMPEFEAQLKILLNDIFNPDTVFDQTSETEFCKLCPYKSICYR